ncbi:MAG: hypothetical protein NTX25_20145 [Proteobacteria bacterium]|nr:hypothetical protein [Pseudomonadota bacterium]
MLKRSITVLAGLLVSFGCRETKEFHQVKNFQIYVDSDEEVFTHAIKTLAADYNSKLGIEVLNVVDTEELSNSVIHFKSGMSNDNKKLGLGQWHTATQAKTLGQVNKKQITTVTYGMEITFDRENFKRKSLLIMDTNSDEYKHLFHLFTHEVGHGMQLDHNNDASYFDSIR